MGSSYFLALENEMTVCNVRNGIESRFPEFTLTLLVDHIAFTLQRNEHEDKDEE